VLSPAEKDLLSAFKAELSERFGSRLATVVLFGSRSRGEGRDDSDLDVLVAIRAGSRSDRRAVLDLAADLSVERGLVMSPLVVAFDGEELRDRGGLVAEILEQGMQL
jgi:uncharacterized protein